MTLIWQKDKANMRLEKPTERQGRHENGKNLRKGKVGVRMGKAIGKARRAETARKDRK